MLTIEGREKITTEQILTNLFKLGFDRIDPVLYTYVLASLKPINFELSKVDTISNEFKEYVVMDGPIYVLKKDMNHDLLYRANNNENLYNYLEDLDYAKIIYKKLEIYGLDDFDVDPNRFCEKEINIIKECNERINAFNKMDKKYREIEEMKLHTDYINWLIDFTKKQNSERFYDINCVYYSDISEEDKENVKKLCNFIRAIGDYANDTGLPVDYESIKVKYKDIFLEVGEFHGQGTLDYAKILHGEDSDEVIDYEKLVNYYSRIASNICPPPTFKECSKKLKNIPNKEDI